MAKDSNAFCAGDEEPYLQIGSTSLYLGEGLEFEVHEDTPLSQTITIKINKSWLETFIEMAERRLARYRPDY